MTFLTLLSYERDSHWVLIQSDVFQGIINRSTLLEWRLHVGKKGVEDVKVNQRLIVKGFGYHERIWILFCSRGQAFEPCLEYDADRSLFLSTGVSSLPELLCSQ